MQNKTSSLVFLRYLTTVFDNIKDAVVLVSVEKDDTYRLLLANPVFYKMSGYPEDSVGKEINEFISPEGYDSLSGRLRKVREQKQTIEYTRWARVPAGRRAFELRLIPILNTVDEVVQVVAIVRDVTTLAKLKDEVQELRAELASRK